MTPSGPVFTTCDFDNGGWTLIGEDGSSASKYVAWLRKHRNPELLAQGTQIQHGVFASIDAVDMAVNHATKVYSGKGLLEVT